MIDSLKDSNRRNIDSAHGELPSMADSMTLFIHPLTHNPIKLQLVMSYMAHESERIGKLLHNVRLETVELEQLEHKSDSFQKLNPNGKVPVLIHNDFTLWESNAIAQYMSNYFNSVLWPYGADQQASLLRWLLWESSCWDSIVGNMLLNEFYLPFWGYPGDDRRKERNRRKFTELATLLNKQLQRNRCVNGDEFTLADLCIGASFMHLDSIELDFNLYPAIQGWRNLLSQQPWWQEVSHQVELYKRSTPHGHQRECV
ncbi:glutathione S-transferase family protein [Pseudomaricurvus sp.]|uniref:glutathione S-transferase family protein n=1 Tax=Pseudomaricurvus sp. TaxID=2004510 RepID=UPI003F6B7E5E